MRLVLLAAAIASSAVACVGYLDRNYGSATAEDLADATADGHDASSCVRDAYACRVLADQPLSYLRFDEASLTAPVHDETGRCTGTYPDARVTLGAPSPVGTDVSDRAVQFDPGSPGIRMNPCFDMASDGPLSFSVELWVQAAATTDVAFVLDHEDWSLTRSGWAITIVDGVLRLELWNGGNSITSVESAAPLALSTWHHCVFTYDGENGKATAWVDGTPAETTVPTDPRLPPVDGEWRVGSQSCSTCNGTYRGAVDEVAVYDRVLTESEVRAHQNAAR